ncbi:putative oxidoreductase [Escovopsis weberi]|uniref:Putative oxidoreductase n=1 Tax=Escovopsis weberi TaxID=150374 RepID=A0A0M8N9D9_ESCWE|nr:putative oxidoreductase [Escovopsis weberi]
MNLLRQFFPPSPAFTEEHLPDLAGRVYIITGGYSGIGLELAALLYRSNATVYLAGRSEGPARRAIRALEEKTGAGVASEKKEKKPCGGALHFMHVQLDDLAGVRASAEWFLQRETRLDVLWNNAGLMGGDVLTTRQGNEIHVGTNCLGHFLLTKLLHPLLAATAAAAPPGTVRVVWLGSLVTHLHAPRRGGMDLARLDFSRGDREGPAVKYAVSKVGAVFAAAEWARRDACSNIVHLSVNPGNLKTPLQRQMGRLERAVSNAMLYDAKYGAYSELWAGLSPDITPADSGRYAVPWGRWGSLRADIEAEMREGEGRKSFQFFEWCEAKTAQWCGPAFAGAGAGLGVRTS